jgi:hypothetical protein
MRVISYHAPARLGGSPDSWAKAETETLLVCDDCGKSENAVHFEDREDFCEPCAAKWPVCIRCHSVQPATDIQPNGMCVACDYVVDQLLAYAFDDRPNIMEGL